MKKVGDLMREMGFREDAPLSTKEAFIKNLIKQTTGISISTPSEKREASSKAWTQELCSSSERSPTIVESEQLSFDLGPVQTAPTKQVG